MGIFKEYLNDESIEKRQRAKLWESSICSHAHDIKASSFLLEIVRKHIEGEISIDEVCKLTDEHYKNLNLVITESHCR